MDFFHNMDAIFAVGKLEISFKLNNGMESSRNVLLKVLNTYPTKLKHLQHPPPRYQREVVNITVRQLNKNSSN